MAANATTVGAGRGFLGGRWSENFLYIGGIPDTCRAMRSEIEEIIIAEAATCLSDAILLQVLAWE